MARILHIATAVFTRLLIILSIAVPWVWDVLKACGPDRFNFGTLSSLEVIEVFRSEP